MDCHQIDSTSNVINDQPDLIATNSNDESLDSQQNSIVICPDDDDLFSDSDDKLDENEPLYPNAVIILAEAYMIIRGYISEIKLTFMQQKRLLSLLLSLLPVDSSLNRNHLLKWLNIKHLFSYFTLCNHCTQQLDTETGACLSKSPLNGNLRTND
ncbi:unnamed protein product [Didymodactylos carnosus]|nr:unnamed protein product [Didymodactylos carnosus]CAF4260981.1 unnamed protein product [Didymodactylos carnosus]